MGMKIPYHTVHVSNPHLVGMEIIILDKYILHEDY